MKFKYDLSAVIIVSLHQQLTSMPSQGHDFAFTILLERSVESIIDIIADRTWMQSVASEP